MSAQPNIVPFPSAPQSLTEKYRPRNLSDFCGIAKPKEILQRLAERPYSSSWLFRGESGTGKTTAAMALADAIPAQLHHIASQECTVKRIEDVWSDCFYYPKHGCRFHMVLIDEADQMSSAAQVSLLSKLDSTTPAPDTIWIFTANSTERFESRFLSRCRILEFSNYGIQRDAVELLTRVWNDEVPGKQGPDFARIVKDAKGNVRQALMALELDIMLA